MPSNKEALVRYRAINRCLINNNIATKQVLISACTEAVGALVSWRTIAGDINAMRNNAQLGYMAPSRMLKAKVTAMPTKHIPLIKSRYKKKS